MVPLLVGLALLGSACQTPPPAAPPPAAKDAATLAAEALGRGDWTAAADLYRRALVAQPESLALHYGLAVAASHLNLKDEAIREFRWVLARGAEGSPEVDAARRWLTSVGALPPPPRPAARDPERRPGHAVLEGRAVFGEPGQPPRPMARLQLFLMGRAESPAKDERYVLRTDEQGRFRFPDVAPGTYKLTNRLAGPPIWRLRVEIGTGEEKALDLTPANSVAAKDDFPGDR